MYYVFNVVCSMKCLFRFLNDDFYFSMCIFAGF